MSIGTFMLIRNEIPWIKAHLESWLPHLDEMVFYDGNSTDGTLEVLLDASKRDGRVRVFEDKDPKDLQDDYVRLFDECLHHLNTEFALFAHPDMVLLEPGNIRNLGKGIAYYSTVKSYAGDPGGQLYEITSGRSDRWKNVYRMRNPDLGLHYWGHYGHRDEDCYFKKITANEHKLAETLEDYTYPIPDSGIVLAHYSDVRPLERRTGRMMSCYKNNGYSDELAHALTDVHPRVTLKDGFGFKFTPVDTPQFLKEPVHA